MHGVKSVHSGGCAGVLLAAALVPYARAQSCIWSVHEPLPSQHPDIAVYHAGLQRVIVLDTYSTPQARMWAWTGTQWILLSTGGPPRRYGGRAAYDMARDRLVLFGGYAVDGLGSYVNDTWEWDGAAWTQIPANGPSPRAMHGMVYDEARGQTVLFGGRTAATYFADTWEWNGQAWKRVATSGPLSREATCFAYDSVRRQSVLYGGYRSGYLTDLWDWDGTAWAQRTIADPSPRGSWMVFDPGRARMIIGGRDLRLQGDSLQTWELDTASAQWTLRDPGYSPAFPGAFDLARSRAVFSQVEYDGAGTVVNPPVIQVSMSGGTYNGPLTLWTLTAGSSLSFQWRRNGQPLANGGSISGATTNTLAINPLTMADTGTYEVVITSPCHTNSGSIYVQVRHCYANCDQSTTLPVLTANDFVCFFNAYANNLAYADCDGASAAPTLTANDFTCFINFYAMGCP